MKIYTLCQIEIKKIREATGMNRKEFCEHFNIPYRTVTEWERGTRRGSACCESLPKSGKSDEKVENPELACWKSLPKEQKSVEKGREIRSRRLEISTQKAKNG